MSAEDEDGGSLQREIKVHASQHGKRFEFNPYGTGYIGAFFRNDEQGERIITGQQKRRDGTNERPQDLGTLGLWKAEVEEGNFCLLYTSQKNPISFLCTHYVLLIQQHIHIARSGLRCLIIDI